MAALIQLKGKGAKRKRKSGEAKSPEFGFGRTKYFLVRQFLMLTGMLITVSQKVYAALQTISLNHIIIFQSSLNQNASCK